jgi:pilus assembly protein Flp/PilA
MHRIAEYFQDEDGASAAEYALILAVVAGAIVGGLASLGNSINNAMSTVAGNLNQAAAG